MEMKDYAMHFFLHKILSSRLVKIKKLIRAIIKYMEDDKVSHGLYTSTHQLAITGDDNVPTQISNYAIILRPDLSTSHEESENNCYGALVGQRKVGHGISSVVSDQTGVFILLLRHFTQRRNSQLICLWNLRLGIAPS